MISVVRTYQRFVLGLLAVAGALAIMFVANVSSAHADPYPPVAPTGTHRVVVPTSSSDSSGNAGTDSSRSSGLSSTGFQAIAATTIAVALLGGGAIFLGLGRRRRHG